MVEVRVVPPFILFTCPVEVGDRASSISTSCKYDKRYQAFKAPFGMPQMVNLYRTYPNAIIVEGQQYVDKLKAQNVDYHQAKDHYSKVFKDEIVSSEFNYNFKLKPFHHQLEALRYLDSWAGAALFMDCGTGKTATSIWDIDLKYRANKIRKSSVLVVGKLMTLFSGWYEDCAEFADLSADVLWQPSKTKIVKGEKEILNNHGPKPPGKGKTYEKTKYYFKKSGKEAVLSSASKFNERKHIRKLHSWKQVGDQQYGDETLTAITIRNIRSENIRAQIASDEYDVHIINHEGILGFEKELIARNYDYIIVDESTVLKNPKGKIYAALLKVAANSKYRRILSGTPSPQGPQDLWSQFFFLDNGLTLGASHKEFMDYAFNMVKLGTQERGTYSGVMPVIRKHGAEGKIGTLEYVNSRLQNRIYRCKLRDCVDLPPLTFRKLDVFLDDETQRHYDKMKEELFIELENKKIEVTIDLAKIMKLRQITSGFIIDKEGNICKTSKRSAKMEVFGQFIEEIDPTEKVVIFAIYKEEIRSLLNKFGKEAVSIYGDTSAKDKLENQKRFINDPSVRYIICQPDSAAYGVNKLTIARYLVFYSIDYRADTMYQAIKRIERTGQLRSMFVLYLCAKGTIDEAVLRKVNMKRVIQQETIDVQEEFVEKELSEANTRVKELVQDFRREG